MSFFSKLWKGIRGVAAPIIGGAIGGPVGAAIGGALAGSTRPPAAPMPSAAWPPALPAVGVSQGYQPAMAVLPRVMPALPQIGRGAGLIAGAGIAAARRVATSAMTYCRRHPAWCASIGGVAAVEGLIRGGQLPPVKRRRAKGISGRELQAFRRVSRTLNRWCKVPAPTQRARRKC